MSTWEGPQDPEGVKTTYWVEFSPDGGKTWFIDPAYHEEGLVEWKDAEKWYKNAVRCMPVNCWRLVQDSTARMVLFEAKAIAADFSGLEIGDKVKRVIGAGGTQHVKVVDVRQNYIVCNRLDEKGLLLPEQWDFDRKSGIQIGEDNCASRLVHLEVKK